MSELIEIALSFPTVVFTVLVLVSVGYWLVSAMFGFAGDVAAELDIDADFDIDGDTDFGSDVAGGSLIASSIAGTMGLHLVPVSVSLTVLSLAAWLASVAAVVLLDGRITGWLVVLLALAIPFYLGMLVAGRVARWISPVFATQRAERHDDLIGRIATIHTGRVDASFGQATVRNNKGDEHLIQVRCSVENDLKAGDRALLVDVDDGVFTISTDTEGLI